MVLKKHTGQVKREIYLARCNNIDIDNVIYFELGKLSQLTFQKIM